MTSHIKTIIATGLLLAVLAGPAKADPNYGVVRNGEGTIVRTSGGNCVHTKWLSNDRDVCPRGATFTQDERTVLFEFNKSTLTQEARAHLDTLIAKIKAVGAVEGGQLVGYADRIGKPGYNERLSKKRVETVRAYMMAHGLKMTAAKTRWVGDTEPTTDCPNGMPRKELIKCLHNDRRVEVELVYDP